MDDVVDPLAGHEPAQLKHDELVGAEAELGAGLDLRHRTELRVVEAARHHRQPVLGSVIQPCQVLPVLRAFGDDRVGSPHDRALDADARGRERIAFLLVLLAHEPQRMEGDHERQAQLALQVLGHHARHEEVGVDQVVPRRSAHEALGGVHERRHVFEELLLGNEAGRPGGDVDHADPVAQRHLRPQSRGILSREDIDLVAEAREVAGDLVDIDVLPSRIDSADGSQRGSMFTDQRDA